MERSQITDLNDFLRKNLTIDKIFSYEISTTLPKMILSRIEAYILKSTLSPGTQSYSELERALILGQGLVTLSDGTKIDTTRDSERLLGGGPPQENALQRFDSIVEKAHVLSSLSLSDLKQAKVLCDDISEDIHSLTLYAEGNLHELEARDRGANQELLYSEANYADASSRLREHEKRLGELRTQLEEFSTQKKELEQAIESLKTEKKKINEHIKKEETKRKDATTDWFPPVAIFGGLLTGRYYRMIPFHSIVEGIESEMSQRKESFIRQKKHIKDELSRINEEIQKASTEITNQNSLIERMRTEIFSIAAKKIILCKRTQLLGRQLTTLRELGLGLKNLGNEYDFLIWDVNTISGFFQDGINVNLIPSFIERIKVIQGDFLTWGSSSKTIDFG